ncbi:MAG: hypothetical protein J6Y04_05485 [Bacteroidaceae bacterium]|nr:hypothetical protein [Bacteroidaceae bacterium]
MLYSTIVQRDETGFNQIYDAAREFEEENVLEALLTCKFDMKKVNQTLNLVRIYQNRLNIESMDLVEFSENFIEQYATDHNECFRVAEKLIRRIGTTITGSMKIFRKFCPRVHRKIDGTGNVVFVLDYSRLTFRQYHGQFFGPEVYNEAVQTLLHELTSFFYHLVATLKVCKDMIHKEEEVRGDFQQLKYIYEKSCHEVLSSVRDVFDTFGQVKLISDEELAERRRNARPLKERLAKDYHAHDRQWMKREAYIYQATSGRQYGLDEKASVLWKNNPEWGKKVCNLIPKLDTLNIPYKHSKKAESMGKKGTFDAREMVNLLKWSGVSRMSPDGKEVLDEVNERQFYLYLQEQYTGDYLFPSWQAVCRERKFLNNEGVSQRWLAQKFAERIPKE